MPLGHLKKYFVCLCTQAFCKLWQEHYFSAIIHWGCSGLILPLTALFHTSFLPHSCFFPRQLWEEGFIHKIDQECRKDAPLRTACSDQDCPGSRKLWRIQRFNAFGRESVCHLWALFEIICHLSLSHKADRFLSFTGLELPPHPMDGHNFDQWQKSESQLLYRRILPKHIWSGFLWRSILPLSAF